MQTKLTTLALLLSIGLTACGGGGGDSGGPVNPPPPPNPAVTVQSGFVSSTAASTTSGNAALGVPQYGQINMLKSGDVDFLAVAGRDLIVRIPVSAAVSGLGAPKLRLTITNLGPGGLTQTVTLDGAGALPTEPSVAGAYFYRLTGDKLTAGTYKLTAELDAENALSNDPKSDNVITDSFVVSPAVNLVVNTGAIRQFVDHLTPAPKLPADADLRAALLAGLPVSSVTIKPYPIPLQAFMSGEMGGADLAGANMASMGSWPNPTKNLFKVF